MRRLLWRLFAACLALIILCSVATGFYAWRTFRTFFVEQTEQQLRRQGQLVRDRIAVPLDRAHEKELEALARQASRLGECRVTLISPGGEVVGEGQRDPESMQNHANRPEVREALAGGVGVAVRYSATLDEEMVYVAIPVERDGQVAGVTRVAMPLTQVNRELAGTYVRISLAAGVVIVLVGLLALWLSRRVSRPFEEIRRGADRFARGDLSHRLYVPRTAEAGAVAESLNQMASQLDEKIRTVTAQKAQQEAILSSMAEGVMAVDVDGRIVSANQSAAGLFALAGESAMNRPLAEVIRNAPLERVVREVLAGGDRREAELTLRTTGPADAGPAGPAERTIQVHATPLRDPQDGGTGVLLVFNDITRLRRLERIRQDFVANVSHELKTPITSIKGFVETLRDGAADEPDRAKRFLEIIAGQADRLGAIIEDLLNLSRLEQESERAEIRTEAAPLGPVIAQAVAVCQPAAEARKVDLRVDCPANLSARINAPLLEQAVSNLLDNAIKYSEPGQSVRVYVEAVPAGVDIHVQDHGCGIPREHLPRLFERFYRVDKARSRQLGGTGLGLAIVKHIANALGGTVSVVSEPGSGSTFSIHLRQ